MKIMKTAKQKNVLLNKGYYSMRQIEALLNEKKIFYFYNGEVSYSFEEYLKIEHITEYATQLRIFLDDMKEVKIIVKDGYYTTVAVDENGSVYYIEL